ncbi:cytochrome c [Bacillus timonensis]|nr:cytochrome c [Bacillus timonensis]
MKFKLLALILGTSLMLVACGGGDDAAEPNEPAGGDSGATTASAEKIYKQNCAGCHGGDLGGGAGPNLTAVGSKYSQEDIASIIANGKGIMQGGIIKGEEADAVAAWLAEKK